MEIILSTTPDGIELQRNPSVFKMGLVKRVFLPLMEEWFNGILAGLNGADLIILSFVSALPGLSCLEKFPNVKAIGIYTFPSTYTAKFSPPALGGKSESLFQWINSLKWKMMLYAASNIYNEKINQLRMNIDLPPIKLHYEELVRSVLKKPMLTATIYSKYLIPRPSDWQENEFMVGPIIADDENSYLPSNDIVEFLDRWKNKVIIYVGIGSMMSIMLGINEQLTFLTNIKMAISNNNCKAIMSLAGFQHPSKDSLENNDDIFYLKQGIPHTWLFSKISAAIHHGGAGTTHTSIRYGLPTLIIPFGADQPFNADRVFINQLGPRPVPIRETNVTNLTKAIQDLTSKYTIYRENAKRIGDLIKNEDGLGQCVSLIEREFTM